MAPACARARARAEAGSGPGAAQPPGRGVRVRFRGAEAHVRCGETLRTALLEADGADGGVALPSPHTGAANTVNCRGLGTCGTCSVRLVASGGARVVPAAASARERARLSLPPYATDGSAVDARGLRLACMVSLDLHCDGAETAPGAGRVDEDGRCGGATVEVYKDAGFWGASGEALPPLAAGTAGDEGGAGPLPRPPLGELEYVLDGRRRERLARRRPRTQQKR